MLSAANKQPSEQSSNVEKRLRLPPHPEYLKDKHLSMSLSKYHISLSSLHVPLSLGSMQNAGEGGGVRDENRGRGANKENYDKQN